MAFTSFFGRQDNFWDVAHPMEVMVTLFGDNFWDVADPMEVMVTLFDDTPATSYALDPNASASTTVDWKETPKEHVFKADLPGLRKEDVKVQLEDAQDPNASASTTVDWKETPKEHVFKADLPGLRKEDMKVQLEDGRMLSISGKRKREEVKETDIWHRLERSSGRFMRKFRLSENADLDHITAKVDNGVVTVVVPKVEKKKETRTIEIAGHDEKPTATTPDQKSAGDNKRAEGTPGTQA